MKLPYAEPFRIKMVEEIYPSTPEQRETWLQEAHYNLFNLKSSQVFIDLLTESNLNINRTNLKSNLGEELL